MVFKRGEIYWYRFRFRGIQVRESTKSTNKGVAERLEREHRRRLELNQQGLEEIGNPILFSKACEDYITTESIHWAKKTRVMRNTSKAHILPFFGKLTLTEISAAKINEYQRKRLKEEPTPSNRTVNIEVSLVRLVMRKNKLWNRISDEVRMLRERKDVGRALTEDETKRLLEACRNSSSKGLYTAVLVSIHTGLRSEELRLLRWNQVDFIEAKIIVGKSKTQGGEGREVYLSETALATLKAWHSRFKDVKPHHCVFPSERYGLIGRKNHFGGTVDAYKTYLEKPQGSFATSWETARKAAGVKCRWHDLRHCAVSAVGAGGATEATMKEIFGWMSPKMMERYSHARQEAKRKAVAVFDNATHQ